MKGISRVFVDFLFILLASLTFLVYLTVTQMNPKVPPTQGPERKAILLVEMTWPAESADDIDLWLLPPSLLPVSYVNKDRDGITLDRDDTNAPYSSDWYTDDAGQRRELKENHETIAIRALVPGRYVVNTQVYRTRDGLPLPFPARVSLVSLNPVVRTIVTREVVQNRLADQRTAFSFTLTADGQVTALDTETQIPFIDLAGVTQ